MAENTPERPDRNRATDADTRRAEEIIKPIEEADAEAEGRRVLGLEEKAGAAAVKKGGEQLGYVSIEDIQTPRITQEEFDAADRTMVLEERIERKLPGEELAEARQAFAEKRDRDVEAVKGQGLLGMLDTGSARKVAERGKPLAVESMTDAERRKWEAQQLAAATPNIDIRGGVSGGRVSEEPSTIERAGAEFAPRALAEERAGATEVQPVAITRATPTGPERFVTKTSFKIESRTAELEDAVWLRGAIEAAGDQAWPETEEGGGKSAWEKFQRDYVKRFPKKGPKPTGAAIHKFQAEWCQRELGIDLYADAAKMKAEAKAKTVVEIRRPLEHKLDDKNLRNIFQGIQYEIANRIGVDAQHVTPDYIMALYGINTAQDIPADWGKKGDELMFNPAATDVQPIPPNGSLAFVRKADGERIVIAQKGMVNEKDRTAIAQRLNVPAGGKTLG